MAHHNSKASSGGRILLVAIFLAAFVALGFTLLPRFFSQSEQSTPIYSNSQEIRPVVTIIEPSSKQTTQASALPTGEPGWLERADGSWLYFGKDGSAASGWKKINGTWYYFDTTGILQTGWYQDDTKAWYFTDPESYALAMDGWYEIWGVYHAFDNKGAWIGLENLVVGDGDNDTAQLSERQKEVLWACDATYWPGPGLCATWVSNVYDVAQVSSAYGNADEMYEEWCHTSDYSQLKPGMMVAVPSHPHSDSGSLYGHIGIYIGNKLVRDSGPESVRTVSLASWLAYYGATEEVRWGWPDNTDLSTAS